MGKPTGEDDAKSSARATARTRSISIDMPEGGRYLLVNVLYGSAARKSEVYVKDLAADGPITPIVNDSTPASPAASAATRCSSQTNWKAPNNRILAVDLKNPVARLVEGSRARRDRT